MENQPETTLMELIRYNNWANAQIIAACQKLTADQLAAAAPGTYGTIHETLGHMIYAEADYVGRMTGDHPQPSFRREDGPSLDDFAIFAKQVASALLDAAQRIPPTSSMRRRTARPWTTRRGTSSSRPSTTASSTAPTSPPSSAASVCPPLKWMAGHTSLHTRIGLS